MANTTFTVLEVPGSKRASARPYTHAVIGCYDGKTTAAWARAEHAKNKDQTARWDAKHWRDAKRTAEAVDGQLYRNHNNYMVVATQAIIDIYKPFMEKHPTVESYLAHQEAEVLAYLAKLEAAGTGELVVLQWSMSQKNAMKAVGSFANQHIGLRVVPCVELVKPSKAKTAA